MPTYESKPVCFPCWMAYSYGANNGVIVSPAQLREDVRRDEMCCFCTSTTEDGIYLKVDVEQVPFP